MSANTNAVTAGSPEPMPHLRVRERVVVWVVFVVGAVGLFGLPYAAGTSWLTLWELVRLGALPIFALVPPIVFFVGGLLLVLRRKWATAWIAVHVPLAIAYLSSRHGIGAISAFWWFGYVCEALVVCFCIRLWTRGALR